MLMNWIFAGMAAVAGYYAVNNQVRHPEVAIAKSEDLAINMAVYRGAVTHFAEANPAFAGSAPDSALAFPPWYVRLPQWTNQMQDGTVTVYQAGAQAAGAAAAAADLGAEIGRLSHNSLFAGIARAGMLHSPVHGDTGIVLPAGVPEGAPVWLARLK